MIHKRAKSEGSVGVQLGLIVTPMLDMSFQILAFFIMTYHPAALEGRIVGDLTSPESPAVQAKNFVPPDVPPQAIDEKQLLDNMPETVTVQVKSVAAGQASKRPVGAPSQIFIRAALDTAPELLEGSDTGELTAVFASLEKKLKALPVRKDLKIAADGGLKYQYVLMVYDTAKKAGFERIHFVPPPLKAK